MKIQFLEIEGENVFIQHYVCVSTSKKFLHELNSINWKSRVSGETMRMTQFNTFIYHQRTKNIDQQHSTALMSRMNHKSMLALMF